MRPDASKHIDLLLPDPSADRAAAAGWEAYQHGDVTTARASLSVAAASPTAEAWVHYALGLVGVRARRIRECRRRMGKSRGDRADVRAGLLRSRRRLSPVEAARQGDSPAARRRGELAERSRHLQRARRRPDVARRAAGGDRRVSARPSTVAPAERRELLQPGTGLRAALLPHAPLSTRRPASGSPTRRTAPPRRDNYERYLTFGGPYAGPARDGDHAAEVGCGTPGD